MTATFPRNCQKNGRMTGRSEQQKQWVAAGWCQAKWACQACAVLAPCLLSQLLAQSPVSSTLNGSSRCYSAPVAGWSGWLMNTFPNEGNSSPQSHHSQYTFFAHFFYSYLLFSPPPHPLGTGLHLSASSHLSSSCAHSSHNLSLTSLPCRQPFTNCLPSLFLYSSSALLKAFTIQAISATVVQPKYYMVAVSIQMLM